jgi:hypothetical protein
METQQNELTLVQTGVSAKVAACKAEFDAFLEKHGWPTAESLNPETLALVREMRKKWGKEYLAQKEARLDITRKYDAMKAAVIALEKELDEGEQTSAAFNFRKWELNFLSFQEEENRKKREAAEKEIARASAGPNFKAAVVKAITDYEFEVKQAFSLRLNTETDMDEFEKTLAVPVVIDGDKYRGMANAVALPMIEKDPLVKDIIMAANTGFKDEVLKGFSDRISAFCRELLTQVPARRAQIEAGIEADNEATQKALEAERQRAQEIVDETARMETNVAAIQATIQADVATVEVPKVKKYEPENVVQCQKLFAVAMGLPAEETGMDLAWYQKNMGKVMTVLNKRLNDGGLVVSGVPVVEEIKARRK